MIRMIEMYDDQRQAWHKFLINYEVLRHHNFLYAASPGGIIPNPLLDEALAGLLTVDITSLLDDGLEAYITQDSSLVGRHDKLFYRINLLSDAGRISNATDLHNLRDKRNKLGHEVEEVGTWKELDRFITLVYETLHYLGVLVDRPKYEFFWERHPDLSPMHNDDPKIAFRMLFRHGVKHGDDEVLVVETRKNFHRIGK